MLRYAFALVFVASLAGCDQAAQSQGTGLAGGSAGGSAPAVAAGSSEVKLDLKNVDQLRELIASKKGKVVVVDAWSTYCDPCMKEFPGLVGLHKKYGPEQIACISFCVNYIGLGKVEDEIEPVIEFLRKQNATFDNILSTDTDEDVYKKLEFPSVPAIFVYDREGKLAKAFKTETTYAEVEKVVAPLLK